MKKTSLNVIIIRAAIVSVVILLLWLFYLNHNIFRNTSNNKLIPVEEIEGNNLEIEEVFLNDEIIIALADRSEPVLDNFNNIVELNDLDKRKIELMGYSYSNNEVIKKSLYSVLYPYGNTFTSSPLWKIVENKNRQRWGFINEVYITDFDRNRFYMGLRYIPTSNKLEIFHKTYLYFGETVHGEFEIYTDINSTGTIILKNTYAAGKIPEGINVYISELGNYPYYFHENNEKHKFIIDFIHNAKFLDDDTIVLLATLVFSPYNRISRIILYSMSNPVKSKSIAIDNFPDLPPGNQDKTEFYYPFDVSYQKNIVAFQTADESFRSRNSLTICDLETKKVEDIISLGGERCNIFAFNPDNSNLIAAASKNRIRIIDIDKREIIKTLSNAYPKSIRWSPDGKKLAYMTRAKLEPTRIKHEDFITLDYRNKTVLSPASLWVYDIKQDTLEKIDEDEGFYDFFWINRN